MARRDVRFGDTQIEQHSADTRRRRIIFWVISGLLIFFVLWFFTLPALVYQFEFDRPQRPPMRRSAP